MLLSTVGALGGLYLGWRYYGPSAFDPTQHKDPVAARFPRYFSLAEDRFRIDEFYDATIVRGTRLTARGAEWLDQKVISRAVQLTSQLVKGVSWLARLADEQLLNGSFDRSCNGVRWSSRWSSRLQSGRIQSYLKIVGSSLLVLTLVVIWISRS